MKTIYNKIIEDSDFHGKGKNFEESYYKYIIDKNSDGYYIDPLGVTKVLFKFRKGLISKKYSDIAVDSFLELSKKKHSNRGMAAGIPKGQSTSRHITQTGQSEGSYIASNISGYFDRPLREHRGILGTIKACRTTSFTLNNLELWNKGLIFIQKCSKLYKQLGSSYYISQEIEYNEIKSQLKIPNTVFTTVTSNYNWRTACHKDSGDYSGGLGNLVVVGENFEGGYLGFPQFKVLIKICSGDFLLMDVHQWHCNTCINIKENGYRLSFVMYIREDMKLCKKHKKINTTKYLIHEEESKKN
jgi:hypothetical protein